MSEQTFNAATYLLDRHVDAGNGERVAVRCEGRDVSYRELRDLTAVVAAALRGLGLRREERVMFCMADGVELLAGILGAFRAGIVAVPVSTMLTATELGTILRDSGARALFVSGEFAATGSGALVDANDVSHVVVCGDGRVEAPSTVEQLSWADLLASAHDRPGAILPVAPTREDSPALWLYTSGTTGAPKAAMHRHVNVRHVCETYARQVLGITRDDRCLSVAKLFFAYGLGNSALFPLSVGAMAVLEPRRPTPQSIGQRLREDRPTLFFGVPAYYAAVLGTDTDPDVFSSVRACASAGEALPAALFQRFQERFGLQILDGLGSTEALHIFVSNRPDDVRAGTTGRAVPGYALQIRDADGAIVPVGTPGTLYVRGASSATGYWCRTDTTRAVFQGEWLNTGDTYVQDDEGRYVCLGRSGDMLKAGGIWVSPAEVEQRLLEHPAVQEAAVIGVPDADGLDKPMAFVVLVQGEQTTGAELIAFCRGALAAFKRPRSVVVVEALPRTATGKLQRFKLKQTALRSTAADVPADGLQDAIQAQAEPVPRTSPSPVG